MISLPFWTSFCRINDLPGTTHRGGSCMAGLKGRFICSVLVGAGFICSAQMWVLSGSTELIREHLPHIAAFLISSGSWVFKKCWLLSAATQIRDSQTNPRSSRATSLNPFLPRHTCLGFVQRSQVNEIRSDIQSFKENPVGKVPKTCPRVHLFQPVLIRSCLLPLRWVSSSQHRTLWWEKSLCG